MKNRGFNGLKTRFTLLTIIGILFSFSYVMTSCASSEIADSADVNQAKIHQYYSVKYDANGNDEYEVEAQFRFGGNKGTTLRLSAPSNIYVNDEELTEQSNVLRGCYYNITVAEGNTFNFKFVDTEDKEYINECKIFKVELQPIDEIIVDKDHNIKWIGQLLMKNETMLCVIEDNEGNTVSATSDIVGSESVKVNAEDMELLIEGNGQIYLERSSYFDAKQAAEEGGQIYTEYKSSEKSIKIKKINKPEV